MLGAYSSRVAFTVERVDFVPFLTQDIPRAKHFYAETLRLEIETEGENDLKARRSTPGCARWPSSAAPTETL